MSLMLCLLACNYLAWALLCLGLPRHYKQHYGREPAPGRARLTRAAGWLLSIGALAWGIHGLGWDLGSVAWASSWMFSAIAWVLLQAWRPRLSRWLVPALCLLALGSVASS